MTISSAFCSTSTRSGVTSPTMRPGTPVVETRPAVDGHDVHAEALGEGRHHLQGLVLPEHAVVDEDGRELIADGFRHQERGYGRVDAAAHRGDDIARANRGADLLY